MVIGSVVDDEVEKEPQDIEQYIKSKGKRETTQSYPENYEVCMNLLGWISECIIFISIFFSAKKNSKFIFDLEYINSACYMSF